MEKVCVIGSGGREHAIAKAFAQSAHVAHVYVAPGNPGMVSDNISCVSIAADDFDNLIAFVQAEEIAVTFVGPEVPLSKGIVDAFRQAGLAVVGPTQAAAQLESSKSFAKEVMAQADVPTAAYQSFTVAEREAAKAFALAQALPVVLKYDGLAAGKGVVLADNYDLAVQTVEDMLQTPADRLVIEEFMSGQEFSTFVLANGTHAILLGSARDYKRAYDNDQGLNTGGMGAFSPVPYVDEALEAQVMREIAQPLLQQMVDNGVPYTGVLYIGVMLTADGPKVVEFNARFGDPETEILLPRLATDFYEIVAAHLAQTDITVAHHDQVSLGVIVAAEGYPQSVTTGMPITIADETLLERICFAGVSQDDAGQLVANGGRILMVTATGDSIAECRERVYADLQAVQVPSSFYRRDIGLLLTEGEDSHDNKA